MKDHNRRSPNTILHTIIIQTMQMEVLADFYRSGLGLDAPHATGGDHLGIQLPNAYLGFDQVEHAPRPSGVVSLWFEVDEIDAVFGKFLALGARVKYSPGRKPWGAILAALYDPDGNLFGLTQRGG